MDISISIGRGVRTLLDYNKLSYIVTAYGDMIVNFIALVILAIT